MKKEKKLIYGIAGGVLILVLTLVIATNKGFFNKLKGDITYPTTDNTLKISCEKKEIAVNEEVICTLVGHRQGGITGIEGKFTNSSDTNVSIVSVTPVTIVEGAKWKEYGDGPDVMYTHIQNISNGPILATGSDFNVSEVRIKGLAVGSSTLTFGKFNSDTILVTDSSNAKYSVDDVSETITVIESGSGSGEETPTLSSEKDLSGLSVKDSAQNEYLTGFDKNTLLYTITVPNSVTSVNISATAVDSNATITGTGDVTNLVANEARDCSIVVTAQDGQSTKTYTITVIRQAEESETPETPSTEDNDLKSVSFSNGTLSKTFDKDVTSYDVVIPDSVNEVEVTAVANSENSTVTYSPELTNNKISVAGDTKTLIIVVNNKKSYIFRIIKKSYNDEVNDAKQNTPSSNNNKSSNTGTTTKVTKDSSIIVPNTGNKVIKYGLIVGALFVGIVILLYIRKKQNK